MNKAIQSISWFGGGRSRIDRKRQQAGEEFRFQENDDFMPNYGFFYYLLWLFLSHSWRKDCYQRFGLLYAHTTTNPCWLMLDLNEWFKCKIKRRTYSEALTSTINKLTSYGWQRLIVLGAWRDTRRKFRLPAVVKHKKNPILIPSSPQSNSTLQVAKNSCQTFSSEAATAATGGRMIV